MKESVHVSARWFGWFVCRISQKPLNRFPENMRGRPTTDLCPEKKTSLRCGADPDNGTHLGFVSTFLFYVGVFPHCCNFSGNNTLNPEKRGALLSGVLVFLLCFKSGRRSHSGENMKSHRGPLNPNQTVKRPEIYTPSSG